MFSNLKSVLPVKILHLAFSLGNAYSMGFLSDIKLQIQNDLHICLAGFKLFHAIFPPPRPFSWGRGGWWLSLLSSFEKRDLTGSQFLEGGCKGRGG